ncbi:MAG: error-prone DNA polymerase [Gammaproteobacteria bacterium]|nr:error-prone DNA polymerase [Gammaproteobacteria bacterium]NIR82671.1 error-prone DNA polymerase [Gammaproteobacteria bacterium]NIR89378.1 error-prone DNA polymerase [Gammaproteobacteria bacterium]NIU03819.1 error-prone DNA polymerase [Gammaproteobacteria bacterium]NIV51153.1 DNA polymerase III subunit alpha [Gammaproteobacteria bacterium]
MPDDTVPGYAELHCISNFTFLRGASHPEELVARAAALGYEALALTDECSLAGVVRAHVAARAHGIRLIVGSELALADGPRLVLLAADREGYGNLSELVTRGRRAAGKGDYRLTRADVGGGVAGCLALMLPPLDLARLPRARYHACLEEARWLGARFAGRAWVAVELLYGSDDGAYLEASMRLAEAAGLPAVAAGDVHMHQRSRQIIQDVLSAVRLGCTVHEAGLRLYPNGERYLRSRERLAGIFPHELLVRTVAVARRCRFSLDALRYEYPEELAPPGETPVAYLRRLTEEGLRRRWPRGAPRSVRAQVAHELALIATLGYEPYFLTVYDIVRFARSRGILCQGRGSAANSAVCYCLGITEVDPARMATLFERFISKERNEPPDIDVDFEHERREEVIQYVYDKYGRERAALAATVICYRPRSAARDAGKALGLERAQVDRLAKSLVWWDGKGVLPDRLRELGFDPKTPLMQRLIQVVGTLVGFPRHLSQHVGGFVIARDKVSRLVPIENAAMPERTVIQWDKDDLDALGLLKVDVLALGMLSAIHRALDLVSDYHGLEKPLTLADVPAEDPEVYEMIQHADTVGVFQIESRAQMAMLPRLAPRTFYDLVVEVAIVRPGPIQGGMVHPYLRRRRGEEPVSYPSAAVQSVLERTLGVPIFQEQVMQLAVVAAGFSPGEADRLRRAMAAWRRRGDLRGFEERLHTGMHERGYSEAFAQRIFQQIQGFGEYGFPESHAASFALLVYISAWLKRHAPAAFTCALLNSQPMGFYAPAQLVEDARRHGVEVRPVDMGVSRWDCTLEHGESGEPAVRLGLRMVKGLSRAGAERLVALREKAKKGADLFSSSKTEFLLPVTTLNGSVPLFAPLSRRDRERLVAAGALRSIAPNRHQARWWVLGIEPMPPLLAPAAFAEATPLLAVPTEGQNLIADYAALDLSLGRHPLALLREHLERGGMAPAAHVRACAQGARVRTGGLVVNRQCPSTASGVIFATLEDETGYVNIVVWPGIAQRQRRALLGASLLGVDGVIERDGEVIHVIARKLTDHTRLLGALRTRSRDFR